MYVCMYVYMYVCMCVSTYVCTYVRMYVCTYVCMYVCMHECLFVNDIQTGFEGVKQLITILNSCYFAGCKLDTFKPLSGGRFNINSQDFPEGVLVDCTFTIFPILNSANLFANIKIVEFLTDNKGFLLN